MQSLVDLDFLGLYSICSNDFVILILYWIWPVSQDSFTWSLMELCILVEFFWEKPALTETFGGPCRARGKEVDRSPGANGCFVVNKTSLDLLTIWRTPKEIFEMPKYEA